MLSYTDAQQNTKPSWQDTPLHAVHSIDPETEIQRQQYHDYFIDPATTTSSSVEEANTQDCDPIVSQLSMSHLAPLVDLHLHFQDLPTFIHHPDFDHFAYCWMESQHYIGLSKYIECRPTAMAWFATSSIQLSSIASNYPLSAPNEDPEASTPRIKAAYQRLVHYFNVMHKVIDTIEQGRLMNRSPQEVMLPIFNQLLEKSFSQQHQQFGTPYSFQFQDALTYDSSPPSSVLRAPISVLPSLHHSATSTPQVLEFPPNHQHLQSEDFLTLSSPITPNGSDTMSSLFWTYPVSTHQEQQQQHPFDSLSASPPDTIKNEEQSDSMSTITTMELDPYRYYQPHSMDDSSQEDQDSEYQQSSIEDDDNDDDDEYDNMDIDGQPTKSDTKMRTTANRSSNPTQQNRRAESKDRASASASTTSWCSYPRRGRTATSQRDKLTKDQRRQVVEKTGLKPRNVTYWFSNHKRRFQAALEVFKKLVAESNGKIQTYDDFIQWRKENGLSEDITDNRT
ncbi:unnamed protein product [Absidia cylindrospora]